MAVVYLPPPASTAAGRLHAPHYNRVMSRVIHLRVRGLPDESREAMQLRFTELVTAREWRDGTPWLAHSGSRDLLAQLFFDSAQSEAPAVADGPQLAAASFVRIAGDEADALALAFIARDISERFGTEVEVRDPDNPIAKLRRVALVDGRLRGGRPLESILVRRVIYRRMPDGSRMEMIPPHGRRSAFGEPSTDTERSSSWTFIVHDLRIVEATFLEAEAEAMRIFRGFRSLSSDDRG